MRRIRIVNPTVDRTFKTYLDASYSSGVALTPKSTVSFSDNDLIVVGEPMEEFSEEKKIQTVTAPSTFTLASALGFAHNKETPIYKVNWDFVSIEGRSTSTGVFAELTSSPIQWDSKTGETIYFHQGGTDTWEYRFRFLNSVTTTYSDYSPTLTGSAPQRDSVGYMIATVRKVGGDPLRKCVTDEEILRFFNRGQDIVYTHNPKYWFLNVDTYKGVNGITAVAGTSVYSLARYTTLGHLDTIRFEYTKGTEHKIYHLTGKGAIEFDSKKRDLNKANDDGISIYKLIPADSASSKGYFQTDPTFKGDGAGVFYPNYYEKMADLDTVDDRTQVPIPSILEDYAIAQLWKIKGNEAKADYYEKMFYGPGDKVKGVVPITGIPLLDQMDAYQKSVGQGQPKSLFRYRGPNYMSDSFGNSSSASMDTKRENEF